MAIQFHELPVDAFPENLRPNIARLNRELRELFGLEGAIRNPIQSSRSDATVVRRSEVQVDISRITPSVASVVSGASTVVGPPALTLGTVNTTGSTTTAISTNSSIALFGTQAPRDNATAAAVGTSAFAARADHVHELAPTLQTATSNATLTATDDTSDVTLTNSLGALFIDSMGGGVSLRAPTTAADTMNVSGTMGTQPRLIDAVWASGSLNAAAAACWDARFNVGGGYTASTIIGYDMSQFQLAPNTTGNTGNVAFGARLRAPVFSSVGAPTGFTEAGSIYAIGPTRFIFSPSISMGLVAKMEMPRIGTTWQYGIWIVGTSTQVTPLDRIGVKIADLGPTGSSIYSIWADNRVRIASPTGRSLTVLSLVQGSTGAHPGAHVNFDDKGGDPPSPNAGDLWRNGAALNYRKDGSTTVDLTTGTGADAVTVNGAAASDVDLDDATPAPFVVSGSVKYMNIRWQKDSAAPDNVSGYIGRDDSGNPVLGFAAIGSTACLYVRNGDSSVPPAILATGFSGDAGSYDIGIYPSGAPSSDPAAGQIDVQSAIRIAGITDPVAALSNSASLYVRDNGTKMELVVRFPTGAVQVIATEP